MSPSGAKNRKISMPRSLYSDAHVTVTIDDAERVVRYVRSSEPYASLDLLRDLHQKMNLALSSLPAGRSSLLVDVRDAPARNDDPFEAEITRALRAILPHFVRNAVLVKSAVGRLQAQRMAKSRGDGELAVFVSEKEALDHLRGP
jgi:hypothetical protein